MKGNEPAFPEPINPAEAEISRMQSPGSAWRPPPRYLGLTKREYAAIMIGAHLAGMPQAVFKITTEDGILEVNGRVAVPKLAVEYADLILAELSKESNNA